MNHVQVYPHRQRQTNDWPTPQTNLSNSFLYYRTKIKIEEPHKPKTISECANYQDYEHTKVYCGYLPSCVRCGYNHDLSACTKSWEEPLYCALCHENHPATYNSYLV